MDSSILNLFTKFKFRFIFSIFTYLLYFPELISKKKAFLRMCFVLLSSLMRNYSYPFTVAFTVQSQPAIACSKLTIETLEQGVKCVQS